MKIAYISYLPIADVDFSYLHEAQKILDITCYLFVSPQHINRSVINFHTLKERTGVYEAAEFPDLATYKKYLNLKKIKVINIANVKYWQLDAFRVLSELAKIMDKEYNIIHLTRLPQWFELPFFNLRKKVVLSVHDPIPHSGRSIKRRILSNCSRWLTYKSFKNFVIFNEKQRDSFISKYKLQKKNVIVSRLSCYTCLQPISDYLYSKTNDKYILFLGRITQYKGLQYLLPAFMKVHDKFPDIKLIVAGGGDFSFDIEEYKKKDYIEFRHRFIPDKELIELIRGCLFMVCPYTDATQSGVIMSAFAFDIPVIATNVGGLPEMVKDKEFGIIIPEKSEFAIVEGICKLLSDEKQIMVYSNNIHREYSNGRLSWKKIAEKMKREYQTCV